MTFLCWQSSHSIEPFIERLPTAFSTDNLIISATTWSIHSDSIYKVVIFALGFSKKYPLLAMIALSAIQSFAQTFIHMLFCPLVPQTMLDPINLIDWLGRRICRQLLVMNLWQILNGEKIFHKKMCGKILYQKNNLSNLLTTYRLCIISICSLYYQRNYDHSYFIMNTADIFNRWCFWNQEFYSITLDLRK